MALLEPKKRIGIWIRVSTDMQVKDESPEHHEQRGRYYAEAKGWQIMEVYRLEAVSGKSVMHHAETKRMLADIASGHITGLVFSKLARLARNTKELLEFSEIFRSYNADLISLSENIDTSTPAGRLFYTLIAAMSEWERGEIAERVSASVAVRAKMGKPLGGQASFGYKWENKALVIDETEAPIRRMVYELFLQHQRKLSTAKALNDLGYRTRNGSPFSDTTVGRLLRDPSAKGQRLTNYTKSTDSSRQWQYKPSAEWITVPCEAIVSAALWNQCNDILDAQEAKHKQKRIGPKAAHLLSGLVYCSCGKTMYVFHNSNVYTCKACKNRIAEADIDGIFQLYLKEYLHGLNRQDYLDQHTAQLEQKKTLLETILKERTVLAKQIDQWIDLRVAKELTKESFAEKYQPAEKRVQQFDQQIPELEAEIDVRTVQMLSGDKVLQEAKTLYDQWETMAFAEKRALIENVTNSITIGKEDITIKLSYDTSISLNDGKSPHQYRGS
jgi:site-specific DNA recombinase